MVRPLFRREVGLIRVINRREDGTHGKRNIYSQGQAWLIHIAYLSMIALTWWLTAAYASMQQHELEFVVRDIPRLMDQYVQHRRRTGEWIEAKKVYDAYFHLTDSQETTDGRIDTFRSGLSTWVIFRLSNEGDIAFDVDFRDPPVHIPLVSRNDHAVLIREAASYLWNADIRDTARRAPELLGFCRPPATPPNRVAGSPQAVRSRTVGHR